MPNSNDKNSQEQIRGLWVPPMSMESSEGIRGRLAETLAMRTREAADWLCYEGMHCQSPIEGLMAACFAYRNLVHPALKVEIGPSWSDLVGFSAWVEWKTREPDELRIFIGPQIQLEDRRVDFLAHLLFPKGSWFLAIECDGHQYHVANKAQAAKDRRTDRAILIDGIPTMRFTGSEIWEDAMACVDEVIRYFWVRVKDAVMAGMKEREVPC